jgi:hypothetical protein
MCDVRKCSAVHCNRGQAIFVVSFVAMFSGAESEYTAKYSKIQEENKDTERNRKQIYSNVQQDSGIKQRYRTQPKSTHILA